MIDKPQYIIVAGINGAGKSTLYDTFPILFDKTKRINADELLRSCPRSMIFDILLCKKRV
ncbi:protein of unknown function (plasmid) [Lactiplantibacillus plantarum]|nr:ATPase [Lactiplantibacillus plantarum]